MDDSVPSVLISGTGVYIRPAVGHRNSYFASKTERFVWSYSGQYIIGKISQVFTRFWMWYVLFKNCVSQINYSQLNTWVLCYAPHTVRI